MPVRPCRRYKFTGHPLRMLAQMADSDEVNRRGEHDTNVGESIIPTDVIEKAEEEAASDSGKRDDVEGDDVEEELHESWRIYTSGGNKCVICFGKGETRCLYCYGESTVKIGPDKGRDTIPCPQCVGRGYETCRRCEGSGIRPSTRFDVDLWEYVPNVTNEDICNGPTWAEIENAQRGASDSGDEETEGSARSGSDEEGVKEETVEKEEVDQKSRPVNDQQPQHPHHSGINQSKQ